MLDPRAELNDPSTPPERLAQLAQHHPELGAAISAHPNVYPALQAWIAQYATPAQPAPTGYDPAAVAPAGTMPAQTPVQQPVQQQPAQPVQPPAQPVQPSQPVHPTGTEQAAPWQSGAPAQFGGPAQQGSTQPTEPLPPETGGWPAQPQPQAYDPNAYAAGYPQQQPTPQPAKSNRTALFVTLGAVLLLVVVAAGIGLWWFLGGKLGGSASPEAAAKKLITSVSSLDPLSLYGSLAPSEFSAFEPASKNLLATQADVDTRSAEDLLSQLRSEVKITTTTPLETDTREIVEGEVERVTITEGVIEIDGDPEKVAQAIIDFYGPIAEAQSEAYGYPIGESELDDLRDEIADDLEDELPFEIDFSELEFDVTLVSVNEGGSWYVSPILTFADYAHQASNGDDRMLGDEIAAPAANGAKSAEAAAENLTQAIAAGDYEAIVEQLPLPERRLLSVYGESFAEQMYIDLDDLGRDLEESGFELTEAAFTSKDGDSSRLTIDRLAFDTTRYDWSTDSDLTESFTITNGNRGLCVDIEGERLEWIDYYGPEYDHLWEQWWDDLGYSGGFMDWLADRGYEEYEVHSYSETSCLAEEVPMLLDLGIDEWAIVAVQEGGDWKISPLGTVADISAIITAKIQEAAAEGRLDSLFT